MMEDLVDLLGVQHHITLPYRLWTNGSVEVIGRDLVWTLHCLVSEFRKAADEWDVVMLVANYAINRRKSQVFGGHNVIEVMTDCSPDSAVKIAVWSGTRLKNTVQGEAAMNAIDTVSLFLAGTTTSPRQGGGRPPADHAT